MLAQATDCLCVAVPPALPLEPVRGSVGRRSLSYERQRCIREDVTGSAATGSGVGSGVGSVGAFGAA